MDQHRIKPATGKLAKQDCCGDRYPCNIAWVCSCGEKGCRECIADHLFEVAGGETE